MNVLIIPFISYNQGEKLNNILVDYHLSRLNEMPVDEVYFSGKWMNFKNETLIINNKKVHFLDVSNGWHQENIEFVINLLSDEDKFIITDSDCLIYDYSIFSDIFSWLDEYDIVSNLDGGTRILPTWSRKENYDPSKEDSYLNLMYNIPIMRPNDFRSGKTRFAATLFGCKLKFYKQYNVSNPEQKYESMEQFSRNVAERCPNVKVKELLDIRNSLYISHKYNGEQISGKPLSYTLNLPNANKYYDDIIHETTFGDDTRCTNDVFSQSKYYHIRNFGGVFTAVKKVINNENVPTCFDSNDNESIRLLSWLQIILEKLSTYKENYKECLSYSTDILKYYNIPVDFFEEFLKRTKKFHRTEML